MLRKLTAGLSLLFIAACPRPASNLEREIEQRLERAEGRGFSGAALIRVGGRRIVAKGYGLADRGERRANTTGTAFDVGSILKTLTAIAIFTLDEAGALQLDDRLDSLLPGVPPDKAAITLREILLHRAGFGEYHDTEGDFEPLTREQARARILAEPLRFVPGSDEAYSNSGYTLLADVIETVSGEAFPEYLRRTVFEPAGMHDTGFYSEPVWQRVPTAIGYDAERFGDNDPAGWPYTWALIGNGGLVTTVLDLDRFGEALWSARLFSEATLETVRRDYLSNGAVMLEDAEVFAAAGAGDYGLGGVLIDVPSRGARIVLATNTYESFDIEAFAEELVGWLLTRED